MTDERICPYCNEKVSADETVDTEWYDDCYYDTVIGYCPKCDREFIWTDVYRYSHLKDFREVGLDKK